MTKIDRSTNCNHSFASSRFRAAAMKKLLLGQIALLCCSAAVSAIPEELEACFLSPQPAGTINNRVKRGVNGNDLKKLFPAGDAMEYLHDFDSGLNTFHVAKDTKTKEECAVDIEDTANAVFLKSMPKVYKDFADIKGFPAIKHDLEFKNRMYWFYAHSLPGPNFQSLIASGYVSLQQAQRWLYQIANAMLEVNKKGYAFNSMLLETVYLNKHKTNELLLLPDGIPSKLLGLKKKLEDFTGLLHFIRYVLGVWFKTETRGRFPEGLTTMRREQNAAFGQEKDQDKLKAIKAGLIDFLTNKKTGWFTNWDPADVSELTSWKDGNPLRHATTAPNGFPCLVQAYNSAD